jgi:hypothetical protein
MSYDINMNRLALNTLLLFLAIPLNAERIYTPVGDSFFRGSIQSVTLDRSGYPVLLVRSWDGKGGLIRIDDKGKSQTTQLPGKRNLLAVRMEGENIRLFEAPISLETWMFRILDAGGNTILLELPVPEICSLVKEKGYPPDTVEGYYQVSPDGRYLLSEFRVPDKIKIRRRTEYYNRQVVIVDLAEDKVLFSRFFLTEQGFRDKASPRYFPLYSLSGNGDGTRFVLAGPANKPALYGDNWSDPLYLESFAGETRFRFIGNDLLLQWDHYDNKCRFFEMTEGRVIKEYGIGLRYPVFNSDGSIIASLQDDGVLIYHRQDEEFNLKGFYPFETVLSGCRFGLFSDMLLFLFPSRFEGGLIEWEKMVQTMETRP